MGNAVTENDVGRQPGYAPELQKIGISFIGFPIFFVPLQKIGTMASELHHTMSVLAGSVKRLIDRNEVLRQELAAIRCRMVDLEADNARLRADLEAKSTDCEFLVMSHRLASSPDQLVQTRRLVAKMIRNIDRAIDDLK